MVIFHRFLYVYQRVMWDSLNAIVTIPKFEFYEIGKKCRLFQTIF